MAQVLILGNGKSRLHYYDFIRNWQHDIWVCNRAYEEYKNFPKIDKVGSVHPEMAEKALEFKKTNQLEYKVLTTKNPQEIDDMEVLKQYSGWSTGCELIQEAFLTKGYTKIILLGFDMGGADIYMGNVYGKNFHDQIKKIVRKYGNTKLFYKSPDDLIPELINLDSQKSIRGRYGKSKSTNSKYQPPKNTHKKVVLQYHKTKIAYAPQIISDCINKYSKYYRSINSPNLNYNDDDYDVIHFHNKWEESKKASIIQYHSQPYLAQLEFPNNKYCIAQYPSLYKAEYNHNGMVRNIIDLEDPLYKYDMVTDKIRVAYTPSTLLKNSKYSDKGYAETLPILEKLKKKYPDKFDFTFVHKQPLQVALEAKKNANIVIDECMTGSYHRCTLEALAMGKVAIVYVQPEIEEMFKTMSKTDKIPYDNVYITELEKHLEKLIKKGISHVNNKGRKSWEWMRDHWNHLDIVKEFEDIYDNALGIERKEFKDVINRKKAILVCPSQILKGKKLGKWIDSFDIVIRTNNFFPVSKELQEDYGKKCDVLYVNNQFARENAPFEVKDYFDNGLKWISFKCGIDKNNKELYEKYLNLRSCAHISCELNTKVDGVLTGTIIVDDILNYDPKELYVTGMNFYDGKVLDWENQYVQNYLPEKIYKEALQKRSDGFFDGKKLHNTDSNKQYILNYYKNKKIKFDKHTKKELGL